MIHRFEVVHTDLPRAPAACSARAESIRVVIYAGGAGPCGTLPRPTSNDKKQ